MVGQMQAELGARALPRATPESQGFPSQALAAFLDGAAKQGPAQELHSLMVLRHGKVIVEGWWHPFEARRKHLLYSLSKSFTSSAIGIAIGEGLLNLDDPVLSFFPDKSPVAPSTNLAAMKVRHLLSMSAGQASEPWPNLDGRNNPDWVACFLNHPVENEPGSVFLYNSIATFMVSAILQRLTGVTTLDYLKPRLLEPLGITEATWEKNAEGIVVGGWGMSIATESIAKFGQLYLQDGVWEGRRLLPDGWVAEATRKHIENGPNENDDWGSGYGFQFWRCKQPGCYRADGAFGQLCVLIPEHEMVVAVTARVEFIHMTMDLVWEHLLPAAKSEALPEDPAAQAELKGRLAELVVRGPEGSPSNPLEARVTGKTFKGEGSELGDMRWEFSPEGCTLAFAEGGASHRIDAGRGGWREGETTFRLVRDQPVAAWGTWTSESTYTIQLQYLEEPGSTVFTADFDGDDVKVTTTLRGRFVDPAGPVFTGRAG